MDLNTRHRRSTLTDLAIRLHLALGPRVLDLIAIITTVSLAYAWAHN